MARPLRQVPARGGKLVPAGRDQVGGSESGHHPHRGKGAQVDAHPAGRICACERQISPFSCAALAPRGSSGANEKVHMIRPIVFAFAAASLVNLSPICRAAYAAQPEPEVVDGVAAVVNGDVITYSQVRQVVAPREKLLRSQFSGDELVTKVKEARQAALQDLIDRQLIIQAFKKENFQIPDHYVEERMQDIIRTDFGG